MGLTIHFQLALRPDAPDMDEHRARWAVEDARRLAMEMKRRGAFVAVTRIAHDPQVVRRQAGEFVRYNHPRHGEQYCEAVPLRGWVFVADVGADCEPLRIGLLSDGLVNRRQRLGVAVLLEQTPRQVLLECRLEGVEPDRPAELGLGNRKRLAAHQVYRDLVQVVA